MWMNNGKQNSGLFEVEGIGNGKREGTKAAKIDVGREEGRRKTESSSSSTVRVHLVNITTNGPPKNQTKPRALLLLLSPRPRHLPRRLRGLKRNFFSLVVYIHPSDPKDCPFLGFERFQMAHFNLLFSEQVDKAH